MKFELNITLRCNQRCINCNRMCDRYPARTDDMTLGQIEQFVRQLRDAQVTAQRIKVLGGEPLLHPEFPDVYRILVGAASQGLIGQIKIDTNQTIPRPAVPASQYVRWIGKRPSCKAHLPTLWAPCDLGDEGKAAYGPCAMVRRCGFSLDAYGYLPCSAAIMITRVFGLTHLYRRELPREPWGMDELCRYCVFAMPDGWQFNNRWPLAKTPEDAKQPTESWRAALAGYSPTIFYDTHAPF